MKTAVNASDKVALRVETAAELLDYNTRHVLDVAIKSGALPVVRIGKALRVRRSDLEAWLAQQPVVGQ